MCTCSPEGQPYPGLHKSNMASGLTEVILLLYSVLMRSHPESRIQHWNSQHSKDMDLLEWVRRRPQKWRESWNTSATRTGWESWGCSAWRREGSRETLSQPSSTWRACKKAGEGLVTRACSDRKRANNFKLREGIFVSDVRKKFFTVMVVRHWNRLPRDVMDASSREVFKAGLDGALSNLVLWKVSLLQQVGWN